MLRRTYLGGFSEFFGGTGTVIATTSDFNDSNSWDDFSPTVSLAWQPDAANNYYVTFTQGFKGGGFDPRAQSTAAPDLDGDGVGLTTNGTTDPDDVFEFMSFDPEQVDSYEIGWKYASSNYQHSLALFHMDYQDVRAAHCCPGQRTCLLCSVRQDRQANPGDRFSGECDPAAG